MFLNPKYGLIGMLSFPNWVLFEWLAPVIEAIGIVYFLILLYFDLVNMHVFLTLLLFVLTFSMMYSMFAVFFEAYTYHKYKGVKYLAQTVSLIILEMFIYQPINMFFSLNGHFDFYFKKNKNNWGEMTRTGFNNKENKNKATI
jgi:hypothetical protein